MGSLVGMCTSPILAKSCGRDLRVRSSCMSAVASPASASLWRSGLLKGRHPQKVLRLLPASSSLCAQHEVDVQTEDFPVQPKYELETVHVKFKLQKACLFGQHFFLTGEHPALGLWDPENAIPMNWSEDHIWTAELDIPVGKTIKFKFILKNSIGGVEWQPGADRTLETWKTKHTIVILEDWLNAELQNVTEEETVSGQTNKCTLDSTEDFRFKFTGLAGGRNGITVSSNEKGISFEEEESPITMQETGPGLVPGMIAAPNEGLSPDTETAATSCTSFSTDADTEGNSFEVNA